MNPTVNLNNAECIVQKAHVGYDTYMNICTGTQADVLWTNLDWIACVTVSTIFTMMFLFIVFGAIRLLRN